jgi:hypothetical protein
MNLREVYVRPSTWLTCSTPAKMLEAMRDRASVRKLRLFACACCREVAHLLADESSGASILVAERFADGLAAESELQFARQQAETAAALAWPLWDEGTPQAHEAIAAAAGDEALESALRASEYAAAAAHAETQDSSDWKRQQRRLADLLRDIFGDPFSEPIGEVVLLPNDLAIVQSIAGSIYDQACWTEISVLADALQDAGCESPAILNHLCGPGPHVKGCWAIDTLTDRS